MINGEPNFIVSDACKVLGLTNPTEVMRSIDEVTLSSVEVHNAIGRKRKTYIVNEAGLYELIFKSRKEEAKRFKRWVFSGCLPSLKGTGKIIESVTKKGEINE